VSRPEDSGGIDPDQESVLDSPALGTGLGVRPCGDALRPATPEPVAEGPTLGVAFSGGGFRATFAVLGVIRLLADAGLLGDVRYASSVSGGSVANALLAQRWPQLRSGNWASSSVDTLLIDDAVRKIASASLKRELLRDAWRIIGKSTRTDVLADHFDDWFFKRTLLEQIDPQVRFILNAANLVTGVRFTLERDVIGDYAAGLAPTAGSGIRLAQAVAASAAVPGLLAPWQVPRVRFPCGSKQPTLVDGGAYDNTATEALESERYRDVFLIVINAGGLLRPGGYGRIPLVRDLSRANSLLYRQSTALRTRLLVERFQRGRSVSSGKPLPEGGRNGILVGLGTDFSDSEGRLPEWRAQFKETRTWDGRDLALVSTSFDRFPEQLCRRLVYRGWWLTGAAIAAYYPQLLPDPADLTAPVGAD
jgi:NTE family protein